jgi:integrase
MAGVDAVSVGEAVALVATRLEVDEFLKRQSYRRYMTEIARFAERLRLENVEALAEVTVKHVRAFVDEAVVHRGAWSDPAAASTRFRLTVVRRFLREARALGLIEHDPTYELVVPSGRAQRSRPLTDEEELAGRVASRQTLTSTRLPAAWALGQALAAPSEVAEARTSHVDLDNGRVWLVGNSNRVPRLGVLTPWGVEALAARIAVLGDADTPLVYEGQRSTRAGGSGWCNAIYEVLVLAGLSGEPDVHPSSLTAWAARRLFGETGEIDVVARALGVRSLDRAATIIGWGWQ